MIAIEYKYMIRMPDGTYYKSNREYVSTDFTTVPDEIDGTVMNDADVLKLSDYVLPDAARVQIVMGDLLVGEMYISDVRNYLYERN